MRAGEIVTALGGGHVSATAVMRSTLDRIDQGNPALTAFTEVYRDEAIAASGRIDEALAAGEWPGALAGVPVAVKDFTPLKGKRTTGGSLVYRDAIGTFDPVYVQRLRAAGAIIVGKTNTPEFAHAGFCHNRVFGTTRNPWNHGRTSGGSSGGAGAAVAAGMVPLAEGSDMGGSVRIPAAYCGVVGLKPSLGRIPMDILPTAFDTISHFGPLAGTVEDAWRFLEATRGPADVDPFSLPDQAIAFDNDASAAGLRIAMSTDLGLYAVDDDVVANLERAADALRAEGARVEPVSIDWTHDMTLAAHDHWSVFLAAWHGDLLDSDRDRLDPETVALMEHGRGLNAVEFKRIELVRTRMWRDLVALFAHYDALLCPTAPCTAPVAECSDQDFGYRDANGRTVAAEMTALFNFTPHCPALSVPSGRAGDGMPTAAQIVGRRFDEATVLRIGRAIERSVPMPAASR